VWKKGTLDISPSSRGGPAGRPYWLRRCTRDPAGGLRQDLTRSHIAGTVKELRRIRLVAQDTALSRRRQGFDSPMRYLDGPSRTRTTPCSYLVLASCGLLARHPLPYATSIGSPVRFVPGAELDGMGSRRQPHLTVSRGEAIIEI
jgi:hypothetical protein